MVAAAMAPVTAVPVAVSVGARTTPSSGPRSAGPFRSGSPEQLPSGPWRGTTFGALALGGALASARRRRRGGRCLRQGLRAAEGPDYGTKQYWDDRYEQDAGKTFDWLEGYDRFKEFIDQALDGVADKENARILDLGCGNARLAEEMYDDGYRGITAVDISEVVINSMKERNAGKRDIDFRVANALQLDFEAAEFDLVIDKSTMDALACDGENKNANLVGLTGEVCRVLKPGCKYLVFSSIVDVPPAALTLPHVKFEFQETKIPKPFCELSAFVAKKVAGADISLMMKYGETLEQAQMLDQSIREARERAAAAEQRLKDQAPSSFAVLD